MKQLLAIVLVAFGLTLLHWSTTGHRTVPALVPALVVRQVAARPALIGPVQVLRSPMGGHVWEVCFCEGQPVKAGDLLLKLLVGTDPNAHLVFVKAPVAGRVAALGISPGPYLAAGTPYARLTLPCPIPVTVVALR